MKTIALFLAGLLSTAAHAAVSDLLFPRGGGTLTGAPGNVIFNGEHFVTPAVRTNGAIYLTFLDTNGVVVSNVSLSITGGSPRLVQDGADYLLAWLNTNDTPNVLTAARISQGTMGPFSPLGTNVAEETASLSAAAGQALAVWQTAGSNSTVFARALDLFAAPSGNTFGVAPSAQPQRYPSVDNDGTNYLVAWMEQNVASNDWRVVAQRITGGALNGSPTQVSETNSMRPYATACSFGTNFLIVWSADEGPSLIDTNYCCFGGASNVWRPTVHVRMLSENALPLRHEFSMLRHDHFNTNVAVAFGPRGYMVACYNFGQWVQPLDPNGAWREPSFANFLSASRLQARIGASGDRFCILYNFTATTSYSVMLAPQFLPEMHLTNLRRTNGSIAVGSSRGPNPPVQISTNFIDWEWTRASELPSLGSKPRLFVRAADAEWVCKKNLRLIHWAKWNWAFDNFKYPSEQPTDNELFSPAFPKPQCPHGGVYSLMQVHSKPTCTIGNHTL